ncbi:MAG: hypothetical protein U0T81_10470 [Saprospiraceae bacterium]
MAKSFPQVAMAWHSKRRFQIRATTGIRLYVAPDLAQLRITLLSYMRTVHDPFLKGGH